MKNDDTDGIGRPRRDLSVALKARRQTELGIHVDMSERKKRENTRCTREPSSVVTTIERCENSQSVLLAVQLWN